MGPEAMGAPGDPEGVEDVAGDVDGQNLCYLNNTLKKARGWRSE